MTRSVPYTLAIVGLFLAVSLTLVRTDSTTAAPETDEQRCELNVECEPCLKTNLTNTTIVGNNGTTCIYLVTASGRKCSSSMTGYESLSLVVWDLHGCSNISPSNTTTTTPAPTTPPPNSTTTTVAPTPTTTNATSTTTTPPTTTPTPPPNSTTTATTTTTAGTTTPAPANSTTTAKPPQPAPTKGGFSWASFIGGIVFAAALSSLAYLIWRFYKVRLDRNYHTLSTNLI